MAEANKYDLSGQGGIQVWTNLPDGVKNTLLNGAHGEVIANPHDGGFILVKFDEFPTDPSRVGTQEYVFFNEARSAQD